MAYRPMVELCADIMVSAAAPLSILFGVAGAIL